MVAALPPKHLLLLTLPELLLPQMVARAFLLRRRALAPRPNRPLLPLRTGSEG
jgi:hypothetical protein